jgi:hypothetical protein
MELSFVRLLFFLRRGLWCCLNKEQWDGAGCWLYVADELADEIGREPGLV